MAGYSEESCEILPCSIEPDLIRAGESRDIKIQVAVSIHIGQAYHIPASIFYSVAQVLSRILECSRAIVQLDFARK